MRPMLLLSLAMTLFISTCMAGEEEFRSLSVDELERRLEDVNTEIDELETKAEYLKTESPDYASSPATIERTGFEQEAQPKSNLLVPQARQETLKRLDELYEVKEDVETELDKREP